MGLSWSKEHVQPTKVVLVPPLFQRDGVDARQRDHFASSPYPYYMREVSGLFQVCTGWTACAVFLKNWTKKVLLWLI